MDKLATSMWLALRAIDFADVRYGIPASAVGFRPSASPGMTADCLRVVSGICDKGIVTRFHNYQ
ncbi:MAG: hypothetical protein ACREPZ_13610 [Rhodanobacteraceae bacterium]